MEKEKKLKKPWESMSLIYILRAFLGWLKSVTLTRQEIENDPMIKDQMADLGCL